MKKLVVISLTVCVYIGGPNNFWGAGAWVTPQKHAIPKRVLAHQIS